MKNSFLFLLLICQLSTAQQTTVSYLPSNEEMVNPERGFYRYTDTYASTPYPLTVEELDALREEENHSLIFRYFFLDSFLDSPISTSFLEQIEADFATIRAAGFKVVARFAYTGTLAEEPPYHDSPNKSMLLNHIGQLQPIIEQYHDVILTLQNGFWGVWGENYYSDEFGCEEDAPLSAQNWADRKEVTDSLLAILPTDRLLSVRYPLLKSIFFDFAMPGDSLTMNEAYSGSIKSRIGYHNDCFLVSANDYTFADVAIEKPYWETESRYTIMGGESCGDNPTYTNCENALIDLENAHWTYLNDYYHPDVLDRWLQEGCLEEIRQRLGYRLSLNTGTYDNQAQAGGVFSFSINLSNTGFAAPVNEREVVLIFRKEGQSYPFPLPEEIRRWYGGGTYTLSHNLDLPTEMEAGEYELFLSFPDKAPTLANDVRYAIQLANEAIWLADEGANDLQMKVTVSPLSATEEEIGNVPCASVQTGFTEHTLIIKSQTVEYSVELVDVSGRRLRQYNGLQGDFQLDLEALPTGVYWIKITDQKQGCTVVKKVFR